MNAETKCEVVVDDGNLCGEGPLWVTAEQRLYWTDAVGHKFYSYDWKTRRREIVLENFQVTGCAVDASGGLVFSNHSGAWFWDRKASPRLIASEVDGAKLCLNDCVADPRGRLLTGSNLYRPSGEYECGKLFSIEAEGKARILDEGIHLSNGLAFSLNNKILYYADSVVRSIYAYDYDVSGGTAYNRRVFVQLDRSAGVPDGITVDAEGFLWCAEWYGSCIARYDPDGKLERRIPVPAKQPSSLTFGGPDLTDIFITSAAKPEPTPVMPPGYDAHDGYLGGALFHLNIGVRGREEYRTRLAG